MIRCEGTRADRRSDPRRENIALGNREPTGDLGHQLNMLRSYAWRERLSARSKSSILYFASESRGTPIRIAPVRTRRLWLPDTKQYFEVAGVITESHVTRFTAVARSIRRHDKPFVVFGGKRGVLSFVSSPTGQFDLTSDEIGLGRCTRCSTLHFCDMLGSWTCPRCGSSSLTWVREQRPYYAITDTSMDDYRWPGLPIRVDTKRESRDERLFGSGD